MPSKIRQFVSGAVLLRICESLSSALELVSIEFVLEGDAPFIETWSVRHAAALEITLNSDPFPELSREQSLGREMLKWCRPVIFRLQSVDVEIN
jgi:hypothetical protein